MSLRSNGLHFYLRRPRWVDRGKVNINIALGAGYQLLALHYALYHDDIIITMVVFNSNHGFISFIHRNKYIYLQ